MVPGPTQVVQGGTELVSKGNDDQSTQITGSMVKRVQAAFLSLFHTTCNFEFSNSQNVSNESLSMEICLAGHSFPVNEAQVIKEKGAQTCSTGAQRMKFIFL
jgi:hypothetical protein